jgi:hypothetical protein
MAGQNPIMTGHMWQWFLDSYEKLEQLHLIQFESIIAGLVPICGLSKEPEVKQFLEKYMKKNQAVKDTVKMSLERLEMNSRLRRNI